MNEEFRNSSSFSATGEGHLIWNNTFGLVSSVIATALVVFFVLRPVNLHFPKRYKKVPSWVSLNLDFGSAPILACCCLAALGVLKGPGILSGLKGNDKIQPYSIIVIFFGLAYMSIAFDVQGVFECLALYAVKSSGSNGRKLFFLFWLVTSVVTIVASNDVAILTITPIIIHFTNKMNLDPIPFLLSEFMAANIWSMTLFIGNPTNIIVGVAYKMSFLGYTLWMGLPAIICGISHFIILFLVMHKQIPKTISSSAAGTIKPLAAIKSKVGAVFGCIIMGSCITLLCVSYWLKVELWILCGIFWIIYFARDFIADVFFVNWGRKYKQIEPSSVDNIAEIGLISIANQSDSSHNDANSSAVLSEDIEPFDAISKNNFAPVDKSQTTNAFYEKFQQKIKGRIPTIYAVFARMPWKILPFVLGMFVLVECLREVGWVNNAAWIISNISGTSHIISVFVSGFLTAMVALVINNQPDTILFTMILQEATFANEKVSKAWSLGLILGSNLCANYTIFGALAGIMFMSIVKAHGVDLKASTFSKIGFLTMPVVQAIGCGVIALELTLFSSNLGQ